MQDGLSVRETTHTCTDRRFPDNPLSSLRNDRLTHPTKDSPIMLTRYVFIAIAREVAWCSFPAFSSKLTREVSLLPPRSRLSPDDLTALPAANVSR